MRVTGIQTIKNKVSVKIDEDELFRLLNTHNISIDRLLKTYRFKIIKQLFNIDVCETVFIRDGFFCYSEEYHGSHSWFETKKIRKVTDVEQQIMDILDSLEIIEITYKLDN